MDPFGPGSIGLCLNAFQIKFPDTHDPTAASGAKEFIAFSSPKSYY